MWVAAGQPAATVGTEATCNACAEGYIGNGSGCTACAGAVAGGLRSEEPECASVGGTQDDDGEDGGEDNVTGTNGSLNGTGADAQQQEVAVTATVQLSVNITANCVDSSMGMSLSHLAACRALAQSLTAANEQFRVCGVDAVEGTDMCVKPGNGNAVEGASFDDKVFTIDTATACFGTCEDMQSRARRGRSLSTPLTATTSHILAVPASVTAADTVTALTTSVSSADFETALSTSITTVHEALTGQDAEVALFGSMTVAGVFSEVTDGAHDADSYREHQATVSDIQVDVEVGPADNAPADTAAATSGALARVVAGSLSLLTLGTLLL